MTYPILRMRINNHCLLLIIGLTMGLLSCGDKGSIETLPSDHFYNQRAYPDNFIDTKAIERATTQVRNRLREKSGGGSNWQLEGPVNIGGRITDLAISPSNDDHLYIATAVGGVFRSYDRGSSWEPIFDDQTKFSIGSIAIAPSNSSRIYIGTGEANASGTSGAFFGDGVHRSDDGGDTWTHVGPEATEHIARIVVDPTDPDRIFMAATGTLYGTNPERGVYRSEDGGNTWQQTLFLTDSTACIDLIMHPTHPDTLYAAFWERIRYPHTRTYGGPSSGIHRSFDGGDTWELLTNGLPVSNSETGRTGLAISESDPNVVYASYAIDAITNEFDALFRSSDHGDSWTNVTLGQLSGIYYTFGWYFGNVRVNPTDPDDVMVLGQTLYRTNNGGSDWTEVFGMHVDHHGMAFSKNNPNMILAGNDGGLYISENGGLTWSHFENLPITQFYNVEVDEQLPERIYGGTQDNNTIRTMTGEQDNWNYILGGDGFHVIVDPTNSDLVYAEYQYGNLYRSVDAAASMVTATDGIDENDRTNWNTPVVISPYDPDVLFYGSYRLYRSDDNAQWWDPISNDLTNGTIPGAWSSFATLTTIAPSYNNLDVIYTGSDDGRVNVTFDGGANWESIDADLPDRYVTRIIIHPDHDSTAYVTYSGYRKLDYAPHIFTTTDGGQNWTDISGNLPEIPLNDVKYWPDMNILIVASDMGVWYTTDDGNQWDIVGTDLPMTIVSNLRIHQPTGRLYAGTFGRSIHSFDLNTLSAVSTQTQPPKTDLKLFPNPATDMLWLDIDIEEDHAGQIRIFDNSGRMIHTRDLNLNIGMNRTAIELTDLTPGSYILELSANGKEIRRKFVVS